jgi:hypothetical protein
MKALLAYTLGLPLALVLVGAAGNAHLRHAEATARSYGASTIRPAADAGDGSLMILERQQGLVPRVLANGCHMAEAYRRYRVADADDPSRTLTSPDPFLVDMVYVASADPCPAAGPQTAQSATRLQLIQ